MCRFLRNCGYYLVAKNTIPTTWLDEAIRLDEKTGKLFWREDRPESHFKTKKGYNIYKSKYAGNLCGRVGRNGYLITGIVWGGKYNHIKNHHIVWRLHTNKNIPADKEVDHINGNRFDNKPTNLRLVCKRENSRNQKKHSSNTSGLPGVDYKKGKWRARIRHKGKDIHIGYFNEKSDAFAAWLKTKNELGFFEGHGKLIPPVFSKTDIVKPTEVAFEKGLDESYRGLVGEIMNVYEEGKHRYKVQWSNGEQTLQEEFTVVTL